ncbi:MAG TPA: peptidoglycan DD-metalloendopeptidase family protein, partial [Acidimicrobiales bacterium]
MASGSRAAGRHRPALRWGGGLVAGLLALGGLSTAAGAQTPPAPGGPAAPAAPAPPADNVFPVPAPYEVHFSDDFHACRDGCSRRHKGNDVLADEGAPLVAVESGVIAKVQSTDTGLGGLTVWLRGDSGVAYYYAHNSENLVTEGERVTRGQTIARVGHTGNARDTASHVHFQINVCGDLTSDEPCTINPFPHLTAWAQTMAGGGADGVAWYDPASAWWGLRTETGAELSAVPFGPAGALDVLPLAGDWDGDGQDSVGLYQRSDATFHLRDDEGNDMTPVAFGTPGRTDVWPIAGDFDGDGRDTIGLYQQSDATFVVLVDGGVRSAPLAVGTAWRSDALPVVGDWNGDGKDSVGVYQQADTTLMLVDDNGVPIDPATVTTPSTRPDGTMAFDAYPIAGDWDGDGRDSVGVMWRTADRFDLPVPTATDPTATRTVTADGVEAPAALPVAGDWNGTNLVTLDELHQIFGPLPDEAKVVEGLPALNVAMLRAGITTPARKAAFLATLRNESGFRYDAVEAGSDKRYRGRGFIQITGDFNYQAAGDYLGIDLAGQPDLAINPLVSPAVAAWYWTVARNINMAADQLDMAAVGIAIGYAPSTKRDMMRCADFTAALRYYSGGTVPDSVNCARTPESRRLAFATAVPIVTRGPVVGIPAPQQPGTVTLDTTAIPPGWTPPDGGTPVPSEPSPPPAPPATDPAPPATDPPATDPPATDPPATDP